MKNKELFEKTVNILVKAYQDDTLEYVDCNACAVGNIVAANCGIKLKKNIFDGIDTIGGKSDYWAESFSFFGEGLKGLSPEKQRTVDSIIQAKSTGYSFEELALIEEAFSKGFIKRYLSKEEKTFLGLMSVVDCLMEIHEANEQETNLAKSMFIKETV